MEQMQQAQEQPSTTVNPQAGLHFAMRNSLHYGDKRQFPDINVLHEIGDYWKQVQADPETSARAVKQIDVLLGRVCFEIVMRNGEYINEVEEYLAAEANSEQ